MENFLLYQRELILIFYKTIIDCLKNLYSYLEYDNPKDKTIIDVLKNEYLHLEISNPKDDL